jgi:2-polyprenyl-3-methyl-5-hydroxy-6-metoxy-1,4-benzoquinol methylase
VALDHCINRTIEMGISKIDKFSEFRKLSNEFREKYYTWHTEGQYIGSKESELSIEQIWNSPPPRESDDYYLTEVAIIDKYYRSLEDSSVLEIGCGDGNFTWKLAKRCKNLESWDVDPGAVELTQMRMHDLGITNTDIKRFDINDIDIDKPSKKYDIVFFIQVLEHIPGWNQEEYFRKVFSLVNEDGGVLFISTPNRWTVRDNHDTGKLFIHWFPRFIKVPMAKTFGFGLKDHDPSWPYPPVLHDYVSYGWMKTKAQKYVGDGLINISRMEFFPNMDVWYEYKKNKAVGMKNRIYKIVLGLGKFINLNYYFGDKIIIQKVKKM